MLFLSTLVATLHSWTVLLRLLVALFSASSLDTMSCVSLVHGFFCSLYDMLMVHADLLFINASI
jgi:hypothetical protein